MNNKKEYEDKEYIDIVKDIMDNEKFNEIRKITHHGLNRFEHCIRVSYYSYKITKFLKLDYHDVARAGLLHDFFLVDNTDIDKIKRLDVLINHPKYALTNSKRYFKLSEKEEDIITSHMFPVALKVPKYAESWIVDVIDNVVAIREVLYITGKSLGVAVNFLLIFVLNYWR